MSAQLSLIILTYNEEENLPACLASLKDLDCEIFVVDSGSSDRTIEIARSAGARVFEHPFVTHTEQWQWAFQNLPVSTDWVLGLDADQKLTPELRNELSRLFVRNGDNTKDSLEKIDGFYVKRRQVFRGKWIRYGGYYPKYLLKLFRRNKIVLDLNDMMDHHFYVQGTVAKLQHDIVEENHKENDISFWIAKHNRYATLLASEQLKRYGDERPRALKPSLVGNPDQRILRLKQIWALLPPYVRPFLYFIYRYFIRLGFLDGKEGFIFHFLQGFWFRLLVDIKIDEMRKLARSQQSEVGDRKSEVS